MLRSIPGILNGSTTSWPASGVLGLDMYNMREPFARAGLRYID
jgi:hypothetical protein